jgi:hypothetical protein
LLVSGLNAGDNLVAIDVRPQNNRLYGLAFNSGAGTVQLYHLDVNSGAAVATAIGTAGAFDDVGGNPVPITGADFGIDFNPTVDRLRVITDTGFNFRMDPNTGALIDGNAGTAGINPDSPLNGGSTTADATAYTNNSANVTVTTLYTLDSVTDTLYIQNPPNAGTLTNPLPITLAGNPLDFDGGGLDIPPGINAPGSNLPATGDAFAALDVGGTDGLYQLDLATGEAVSVGSFGALDVRDIAVAVLDPAAITLSADGPQLLRFLLGQPDATTPVTITGLVVGETLAGIDGRPATGQLFGLGINPVANTGTLYRIDPQTGAATAIDTAGSIAYVDASGNPVDFPDPATAGYGVDFNPTVDRLRVVTSSGLNFRINPNNGAPVDGDLGGASGSVAGVNPDGAINNGAGVALSGTAYTNNFSGATVTTQYTLDADGDQLYIQNPPNSGMQTNPVAVTLDDNPLDFSSIAGFDIAPGVSVSTSNVPVTTGDGYAALTVDGDTELYQLDLVTGEATLSGPIGAGTTAMNGLVVWSAPIEVAFDPAIAAVTEDAGSITITVVRSGGAPLVVSYATADGTALAGEDYTAVSGTLFFAAGETAKTVTIPITDDGLGGFNETFQLDLSGPFVEGGSLTVTILSIEVPTLSLTIDPTTIAEAGGTATATVSRDAKDSTSALTVTLGSNDFTQATVPASVEIPAGQTSATFTVTAVNDGFPDGDQIVTISAAAAGFVSASARVTVRDDETAGDIFSDGFED